MAKGRALNVNSADQEFSKKWAKLLPENYQELASAMKDDELEAVIVKSRGLIEDTDQDLKNDNKLKVLKDDIKTITGAYQDASRAEDAKVRYALYVLRQRGKR